MSVSGARRAGTFTASRPKDEPSNFPPTNTWYCGTGRPAILRTDPWKPMPAT